MAIKMLAEDHVLRPADRRMLAPSHLRRMTQACMGLFSTILTSHLDTTIVQLSQHPPSPADSTVLGGKMTTFIAGSGQLVRARVFPSLPSRCAHCASRPSPSHSLAAARSHPCRTPATRGFSSNNSGKRPRFSQRLGEALRNTKIQWYQIPVGLGIGFLGLVQFYKVSAREQKQREQDGVLEEGGRPKRRPRVRPEGPW